MALKAWQRTTLIDTVAASYVERIRCAPAVAVLLGPPSRDLVAIDFDHDEAAADFLALNPALAESLRTHGSRGCSLWAILAGPYPERVVLLTDKKGVALGEWRGGNCYSLICGAHPQGHLYTVLKSAPPAVVTFESIHWPGHWCSTPKRSDSEAQPSESEPIGANRSRIECGFSRVGCVRLRFECVRLRFASEPHPKRKRRERERNREWEPGRRGGHTEDSFFYRV